jgi:c-di-GMP-binding flagellar brake protein YcgR
MGLITPFPEAESPELERFALRDVDGIVALLTELRDCRIMVTLYYDRAAGFTVGHVLEVDAALGAVTFGAASGNDLARGAVARARETVAVAFVDSTKVQFTLAGAEPAGGHAAFRFRLPQRVLRIQRRSAPRRQPPAGRPAYCRLPIPGSVDVFEPVRVLDISVSGLAVLVTPRLFELARDQLLEPCYLDLPDVGQIAVSIRVRYLEAWPSEVGGRRSGCEFVAVSGAARRALERYVERLEGQKRPGGQACAA